MHLTYCVMDFCPSKAGDGTALHKFPRDNEQRDAWIKFVRATGRHYWTPAKTSVLCSLHFTTDSYYNMYAAELGIPAQRRLRPGAVPTVYPAAALRLLAHETGATSPKRQDEHISRWHSQPKKKRYAMGSIVLAASILFTGSSPTQVLRLLQSASIACFIKGTYDRIQKDILVLAVHKLWECQKGSLFNN
ncbi:hypothetical protein V5799_019425 [Amblyomma americanum]|uniref:THAP-type domain-containing protein n=1 Tax=Amblyomma americanum TaxID=6943 RepID=A0AAQ4EXA6_AMBAM